MKTDDFAIVFDARDHTVTELACVPGIHAILSECEAVQEWADAFKADEVDEVQETYTRG
jgi:hypothetical protein